MPAEHAPPGPGGGQFISADGTASAPPPSAFGPAYSPHQPKAHAAHAVHVKAPKAPKAPRAPHARATHAKTSHAAHAKHATGTHWAPKKLKAPDTDAGEAPSFATLQQWLKEAQEGKPLTASQRDALHAARDAHVAHEAHLAYLARIAAAKGTGDGNPDDGDEFTELVDATFPRVDLVGKGANGIPRFLIAKQDGSPAGLFSTEYVRDLIAKTAPEEAPVPETAEAGEAVLPNGIVIKGSAAAMAAFIHAASERPPSPADVAKAQMSAKAVNKLPDDAFAYIQPGGTKDASGRTVPRSLRHFPLTDAAHVRDALSRAPQSPFGDKAMPKIKAAAKKFGIDIAKEASVADPVTKDSAGDSLDAAIDGGQDGLDPTAPLAAPDDLDSVPGDPMDPGSPAWESIDAATASKWTTILAWAKTAIGMLAERERVEAATVDPDDGENACDLGTACDAIDFAIGVLAPYAVGEQSQADTGTMDLQAIGKAAAAAEQPAQLITGLVSVAKAGRVLSSANEAKIRSAAKELNDVLASLPQAPADGGPAAVTKEEGTMPTPEDQAADTGPVNEAATTGLGQPRQTGPAEALPADGPQAVMPGDVPGRTVIKSAPVPVFDQDRNLIGAADREAIVQKAAAGAKELMLVYDQAGNPIGIVDPAKIQVVSGTGKKPDAEPAHDAKPDDAPAAPAAPAADAAPAAADAPAPQPAPPAAAAPDAEDLEPQPSAAAGTPAGAVAKTSDPSQTHPATGMQDVIKTVEQVREFLERSEASHQEVVAKMAADKDRLAAELTEVRKRLETVENTPAMPKVALNGAVPPAQLRGQDQGAPSVNVAKAQEMRQRFRDADPVEQNRLANEMQGAAIGALAVIHGRK